MKANKILHAIASLLIVLTCSKADAQAKLNDVQGKVLWPGMHPEAAHSHAITIKDCAFDFYVISWCRRRGFSSKGKADPEQQR